MGYDFGQVPPFKYLISTSGALPPFDDLNTGVVITLDSVADNNLLKYVDEDEAYVLNKSGTQDPDEVFNTTIDYVGVFQRSGTELHAGQLRLLYPPAIMAFQILITATFPPNNLLPNPVAFLPRKWNFEL